MFWVCQRQLIQSLRDSVESIKYIQVFLGLSRAWQSDPSWEDSPHSLQNASLPSDRETFDGESSHRRRQTLKETHTVCKPNRHHQFQCPH